MKIRTALAAVVLPSVLLVTAVAGGWWASRSAPDQRAPLAVALDSLPSDTLVAGFTDWSTIRSGLGYSGRLSAVDITDFSDEAALRDLSTRSVLGRSVEVMDSAFGWSAVDLEWEVFGQAADGSVMVARLGSATSISDVQSRFSDLGYVETNGLWIAPDELVASVGPELVSTLGVVAVDESHRLIVASDDASYVAAVRAVIDRAERSLLEVRAAADVARGLSGVSTALIEAGRFSCDTASLSSLGQAVRDQADAALARSGPLVRLEFGGRGVDDSGGSSQVVRFAMAFGSSSVASDQATVRSQLASGPFIGRSGQVEDSLDLRNVDVSGSVVTLSFDHDPGTAAFMVGQGPLLFASCPVS